MGAMAAGARSRWMRVVIAGGGLLAALASPAAALAPGHFSGQTSQGQPVTLDVGAGHLGRFNIHWNAACRKPHNDISGFPTHHNGLRLGRQGWRTSGSYHASSGNGYTEYFSVRDTGTFDGASRAHGVFYGTVKVVNDADTTQVYSCHSGPVSFTLKLA